MKKLSRRIAVMALLASIVPFGQALADTSSWPNEKPITWIVGFAPGGSLDVLTRQVARQLEDELQQTIVVENRPGASGLIALQQASRASADGYTLISVPGPILSAQPQPEIGKELMAIGMLAHGPMVLVGPAATAEKDLKALLKAAKAQPEHWSYASSGLGTSQHLGGELLNQLAGTDIVHVPYKGGGQAVSDVVGNQIPLGLLGVSPVLAHIKEGRLKAYAVTSTFRIDSLPDVPTMQEAGIPDYDATQWYIMAAPSGLPADRVQRLNAALNKIMKSDELKPALEASGSVSKTMTPEETTAFVQDDYKHWGELVQKANLPLQ
jgi:tripartite-type tricarboxylate transporter receptor subunit TctC